MSSISSLVLSQARSAVDEAICIVQGQIKAQSEQLAKQIVGVIRDASPARGASDNTKCRGGFEPDDGHMSTIRLTTRQRTSWDRTKEKRKTGCPSGRQRGACGRG